MEEIRHFLLSDITEVKALSDQLIGKGYYKIHELEEIYQKSVSKNINCSFVYVVDGKIKGFRFTYPPGKWSSGKGSVLNDEKWPHSKNHTAYFQSLFIAPENTNAGVGQKLSFASIAELKKLGAKGVACHSWVESPNDSSRKYLRALGFKSISQHKEYWKEIEYTCPLGENPCLCTAEEMYLDFNDN